MGRASQSPRFRKRFKPIANKTIQNTASQKEMRVQVSKAKFGLYWTTVNGNANATVASALDIISKTLSVSRIDNAQANEPFVSLTGYHF